MNELSEFLEEDRNAQSHLASLQSELDRVEKFRVSRRLATSLSIIEGDPYVKSMVASEFSGFLSNLFQQAGEEVKTADQEEEGLLRAWQGSAARGPVPPISKPRKETRRQEESGNEADEGRQLAAIASESFTESGSSIVFEEEPLIAPSEEGPIIEGEQSETAAGVSGGDAADDEKMFMHPKSRTVLRKKAWDTVFIASSPAYWGVESFEELRLVEVVANGHGGWTPAGYTPSDPMEDENADCGADAEDSLERTI